MIDQADAPQGVELTDQEMANIAAGLTASQRDALCGTYSFRSPQEQEVGEAELYRLGLWKIHRLRWGEKIHTPLGLAIRGRLIAAVANGDAP